MEKTSTFGKIVKVILLASYLAFTLFPIYWITVTSFKPVKEAVTIPIRYWPETFTLKNYIEIWDTTPFPTYLLNSFIVSVSASIFTLILAILAGYSLARFKFRGKRLTLLIFLITQMVPIIVMIVPLFILFTNMGLINNLFSLIISYTVISIPFCTLMIRGFFERIPPSIEESAMVDGCSRVKALFRIVIPVMLPGVVATFTFAFIAAWNEFFFSIMFINSEKFKTIPVGLNMFIQRVDVNWSMMSAGATVALIPAIIMFILVQKYLVQGLTMGAVKG